MTTKGYSTRQSVASVTWETRARPSNCMLSLRVLRLSFFSARRRSAATSAKPAPKALHRVARPLEQERHPLRARRLLRFGIGAGVRARFGQILQAAFVDLVQTVVHGFDQRRAPARIVLQIVLQVGVARHHPDVAQHLVQHARRAAGACAPRAVRAASPRLFAEQAQHDLAVGERGVVVRNLAQSGGHLHPFAVTARPRRARTRRRPRARQRRRDSWRRSSRTAWGHR